MAIKKPSPLISPTKEDTQTIKAMKLQNQSHLKPKENECCGKTSCSTTPQNFSIEKKNLPTSSSEIKKGPKTRIIIKYDVGFNNTLFLRGQGANLNWAKGICLKNLKADEWIWETDLPFTSCEFKVLINDQEYEVGENHPLICGASLQYTPRFVSR